MSTVNEQKLGEMLDSWRTQAEVIHGQIKADRIAGEAALRRLLPIAQGHTGQCECVARILLGCYNSPRFPLDLTNLRGLDYAILIDVMAVLRMDANAFQEVHLYFEDGSKVFEQLAKVWGIEEGGAA